MDRRTYNVISDRSQNFEILDKLVLTQLESFLDENYICEVFQTVFKKHHSTDAVILKVFNDYAYAYRSHSRIDTIDHLILISRLETYGNGLWKCLKMD